MRGEGREGTVGAELSSLVSGREWPLEIAEGRFGRSASSGALPRSPDSTIARVDGEGQELPKIPKHLSVNALTRLGWVYAN